MNTYAAHVDRESRRVQPFTTHCENVALLCERYAVPLGLAKAAHLIAILHDVGKGDPWFQAYLNGDETGKHPHSPVGAIFAYERWFLNATNRARKRAAQTIALCVYGHHTGLMDCVDENFEFQFIKKMQQDKHKLHYDEAVAYFTQQVASLEQLDELFEAACKELKEFRSRAPKEAFYDGLTARLLLSMLVDADRYDSACFGYGEDALVQPSAPNWGELLAQLDEYTSSHFKSDTPIEQVRANVAARCAEAASRAPGVYRLTVPTGGGKTLSSLRFALAHAARHGMERIFYIIPFNTILDQNARDIREALADYGDILEHHSNVIVENEGELVQYRHLSERWDSRIILTSMVQFLNALYRCENTNARRMHRLTRSVIVFDEIQALPQKCKALFEYAVNFLAQHCGCTVLLCTATQMELNGIVMSENSELMGSADELSRLYDALARVRWLPELKRKLNNEAAAARLCELFYSHGSVLAIVNTKSVACNVYHNAVQLLKEQGMRLIDINCALDEDAVVQLARNAEDCDVLCVHLSTLLCPAHRLAYIKFMKAWLRGGGHALCVSTALIEAGINISFPAVVRSLAGIPSIVQAAGRCNRNMERDMGDVYIWEFCEENLGKLPEIAHGKSCAESLYKNYVNKYDALCKPEGIREYFLREHEYTEKYEKYPFAGGTLVDLLNHNGAFAGGMKDLFPLKQAFNEAGKIFRVIDDNMRAIIVPYGEGESIISTLLSATDMKHRALLLTRAQQYSVNVYENVMKRLDGEGAIYPIGDTGALALRPGYYDFEQGLKVTGEELGYMGY